MGSIVRLPDSWNTDDENPVRAVRELDRILGGTGKGAFILYGHKWWVIRYLTDGDKFRVNGVGQVVELRPWQRQIEVLAVGQHFGECCWHLRQGTVRAMVGKGIRPIHEGRTRDWIGFRDADGKPVSVESLLGSPS